MTTDKSLDNLRKIYINSREQLLKKIIETKGVGTKTYYNTILHSLNETMKTLFIASNSFIDTAIPAEYKKALDETYAHFTRNNLLMKSPNTFAQLHSDAIKELAREMQYNIQDGIAQVGRQVLRYLDDSRDNALRRIGLEASAEKAATGSTIVDMKKNMIEKLQKEGFMTVQYGSGSKAYQVPLDSYAMLCARSTTREAGNIARENQLIENGYDLVKMTEHYPTCELCARFQGRVYSISGKDKRFPALSMVYAGGYHNVHPNCAHSMTPWIEELEDFKTVKEEIEKSNLPFVDTRNQSEIDLYNQQQAENKRIRQDLYQYERYKSSLGEDAPKTFRAFRRLKKAGGEKWKDLEYYYKYKGDRPIHCVKIDRELSKLNIDKGKAFPADNDLKINEWSKHALSRVESSGLNQNDVMRWKNEAKIILKRYPEPNTLLNYYHNDGIIGIKESNSEIRTVIDKNRFGNETKAILEVIKKYV